MWWQITGAWAFIDFNITWVNCLSIHPNSTQKGPTHNRTLDRLLWGNRTTHSTTAPPTLTFLRQFFYQLHISFPASAPQLKAWHQSWKHFSYPFFKNGFLNSGTHKLIIVIFKGDSYLAHLRHYTNISLISIRLETYESFATGLNTNDGRYGRLAHLSSITAPPVRRLSIFYANTVGGAIYDPTYCKNLQYPNTGVLQSEAWQRRRFVARSTYFRRRN